MDPVLAGCPGRPLKPEVFAADGRPVRFSAVVWGWELERYRRTALVTGDARIDQADARRISCKGCGRVGPCYAAWRREASSRTAGSRGARGARRPSSSSGRATVRATQ